MNSARLFTLNFCPYALGRKQEYITSQLFYILEGAGVIEPLAGRRLGGSSCASCEEGRDVSVKSRGRPSR